MSILNGKGRTYALVLMVLVIWAIIAVQVLGALDPTDEVTSDPRPTARFELQKLRPRDTFGINNDYRDPFSGKLPPGQYKNMGKQAPRKKKEPINFPEIRYHGMVSNAAGGDMVFSLSVGGQEILLSTGGAHQGLRLLKGDADQISIKFKGETKIFNK